MDARVLAQKKAMLAVLEAGDSRIGYQSTHYSALREHLLVGARVDENGLVVWDELMPGTDFYHAWKPEPLGSSLRVCENCQTRYERSGSGGKLA